MPSVSYDYSKKTRALIKDKLSEAKERDGVESANFVYSVGGTANEVRVNIKRKGNNQAASREDR